MVDLEMTAGASGGVGTSLSPHCALAAHGQTRRNGGYRARTS
jgi:hypothetical protein